MKLSVVIAAKNEAGKIHDAIKSVKFADEILVIDDESTDETASIATNLGAKVLKRKLDGFASQKNFGVDSAANDWILILDADERVSPELAKEIRSLVPSDCAAYQMPFKNYVGRKWLKHGGLFPDPHTRLFDRKSARYGQREIHEELEVSGKVCELKGWIEHLTYRDWVDYKRKVEKYAKLEAANYSTRPSLWRILKVFLSRFVKQSGYLDGLAGLRSSLLLAYYEYVIRKEIS